MSYYSGFWTNYGKGPVTGLTLTVSARNGGLLISFLTMFVRVAGSCAWNIIRFILHQSRSTSEPRDGLYHQQQASLKNASSQSQTLLKFLTLSWFWRSIADKTARRSLPILLLVAFHLAMFTVAGLFTSRVAYSSSEALLRGGICGYFNVSATDLGDNSSAIEDARVASIRYNYWGLSRSVLYVKNCYGTNFEGRQCDAFSQRLINARIINQPPPPCPFPDPATCKSDHLVAQVDTGLIDSNKDLGINAPAHASVSYRKVTTCAPVDETRWASNWTSSGTTLPGDMAAQYYFGPRLFNDPQYNTEFTIEFTQFSLHFPKSAYVINTVESVLDDSTRSTFSPNATFFKQSAEDLLLVFLTNNAEYTAPVYDPWFFAVAPIPSGSNGRANLYVHRAATSVIACTEQHQFCNPNLPDDNQTKCTKLTGRTRVTKELVQTEGSLIQLNSRQWATTKRLLWTIDQFTLGAVLSSLGTDALVATGYLASQSNAWNFLSEGGDLPNWFEEVINWNSISLVNLQRWANVYTSGPPTPDWWKYIRRPSTQDERDMCLNQRARFQDVVSFDGLAFVLILVFGAVIMLTSLCLPFTVGYVQRRSGRGVLRRKQWVLDDTLQLQRIAFEGSGQGTWRAKEKAVPLTERGEMLPGFLEQSPLGTTMEYQYPLKPSSEGS